MADIRVKDLTEASVPGADYYLLTDSATDGVKKVKTTNVVKPADIGAVAVGGALGAPSSGDATNLTGTAAGLTAGNVTTNANMTGDVTSVGNATTIASNAVTNAKLAAVADGTIKSNISGASAAPSDNTISAVLDKLLGTTQGSVIYRGSSSWASLTPGTSGQYLQTLGPSVNPAWNTPSGAGDMLRATYDPTSKATDAFAFVPAGTGTATRTIQSKLSDVVDLRDWGGLDLTDTNDNATLFQNALNQAGTSGFPLRVPPGKILLGSTVMWPAGCHIIGSGQAGGSYSSNYSWLHFAHLGIGLFASGGVNTTARSMRGINTYRSQPALAAGWAPIAADFDVSLQSVSDITIDDCMFLNPTKMINVFGDATAGPTNGRLVFRNIKGQPFAIGINITQCYDVIYLDEIHLWPFWSLGLNGSDTYASSYSRANGYAYSFSRVDNPKLGRLFSWGYYRGLSIFNQATVGSLPGGTTSLLHADVLGMDNCGRALFIDASANGATLHVDELYGGGASTPSVEPVISMLGSNGILSINQLYGYDAAGLVDIEGSGNQLTVSSARSAAISGTEYSVANGNMLRLLSSPTITAPTGYSTTGTIETPDWVAYTPTVTANTGTFTTASATGRYRRIGKTIDYEIHISITTNGTAAGDIRPTLPFTSATTSGGWVGVGRETTLTGDIVYSLVVGGFSMAVIGYYNNTYPGADGANIIVSGTYEAA